MNKNKKIIILIVILVIIALGITGIFIYKIEALIILLLGKAIEIKCKIIMSKKI